MNQPSLRIGLGIATAVIVPSTLIRWFTPHERLGLGLGCAPFGWQIVMIVHMVASLPIGVVTSAGLARSRSPERRWALRVVYILLGLAGVSAVVLWGGSMAGALESWKAGFLARDFVRTIIAHLLVLPWLIVAALRDGPEPRIPASPAAIFVTATLAFLPPLVYTNQIVENRLIDVNVNLSSGRLLKAKSSLMGLSDLGSSGQVGGTSPTQALRGLEGKLARLERDAIRDLPASAAPSTRLQRAFLLIQLERLDEAEAILRSLSETSSDALLLLGAVYRDQARWSESERAYRQALASLLPGSIRDRDSQERSATAYDGLAEAARSGGHPEIAEQAYQEARRRLPALAGYWALQLGRHYLSGGRPLDAIAQLRQAARLEPTLEARVRPLILQAQVRTPACLLRSPYR
jgi:hypothetical protein